MVWGVIKQGYDWLEDMINPNEGEQKKAGRAAEEAAELWADPRIMSPDMHMGNNVAPTKDDLWVSPYEQMEYSVGDPLRHATIGHNGQIIQGDQLGRDAQGGAVNYFGGVALDGSPLDPTAMAYQDKAAGYFNNLRANGGLDAAAEAEYQRRTQQAEQFARGQREAALQAAEMRGAGGSGAGLLADLTAGQQAATAQNMAGFQAAADMQRRRDDAASRMADIGSQRHAQTMSEAERRDAAAQGVADIGKNTWQQGLDQSQAQWDAWYDTAIYNTDAANAARYENWSRANQVGDANVDQYNQALHGEGAAQQQVWDNEMKRRQAESNARLGEAGVWNAQQTPQKPMVDYVLKGAGTAVRGNPYGNGGAGG